MSALTTTRGFWTMNLGSNIRASACRYCLLDRSIHLPYRSRNRNLSERRHPKELRYIDKWFESIVKPKSFYEKHSGGEVRRYFYNVDMQGRLFLEETLPKNIATSIKDEKFLNFFFSRIERVRDFDREFLNLEGAKNDYPFISLCGQEVNFIRPAATPIVFHSLVGKDLHFGGNLICPFDSSYLAVSPKTGRLYHKIRNEDKAVGTGKETQGDYGLIRSSVAVALSEHFRTGDCCDFESSGLYFCSEGKSSLINTLSQTSEPGAWALPQSSDE